MATLSKSLVQRYTMRITVWLFRHGLVIASFIAPRLAGRLAFQLFCTTRPVPPKPKEIQVLSTGKRWELAYTDYLGKNEHLVGYTWNEAGAETILLLHGWEMSAGRMTTLVQPLVQQGFRVIAFNAPSHGAHPDRSSATWTNALEYGRTIHHVLSAFCADKTPYGIVAHSISCLATAYFLTHLNPSGARKIVFIAPPTRLSDFMNIFQRMTHLSERVMKLLRQHFEETYSHTVREFDMRLLAKKIASLRILFIHDRKDEVSPFAHTESIVRELPDCEFMPTDNLGHMAILRSPEVIGRIQEFLLEPSAYNQAESVALDSLVVVRESDSLNVTLDV
jgi:pimeloyl-ACP methyl ester carboxylesterase